MSTELGMAKVYFTASDFGKMLKLKDENNLIVKDVKVSELGSEVEVTIITPINNSSNSRVKSVKPNCISDRYSGFGLMEEDNQETEIEYVLSVNPSMIDNNLIAMLLKNKSNSFEIIKVIKMSGSINCCVDMCIEEISKYKNKGMIICDEVGVGKAYVDIFNSSETQVVGVNAKVKRLIDERFSYIADGKHRNYNYMIYMSDPDLLEEYNKLVVEFNNLKLFDMGYGRIKIGQKDKNIGKERVECLLQAYNLFGYKL